MEPMGEAILEFELNGTRLSQSAFVVKELPTPVLLGIPFLEHHSALIDFDSLTVTLRRNVPHPIKLPFTQDLTESIGAPSCAVSIAARESEAEVWQGLCNSYQEDADKSIRVKTPITIKPHEVTAFPIYFVGNLSTDVVTIRPMDQVIHKGLDLLTNSVNKNMADAVLVSNQNPYDVTLFQDSCVGTLTEGPPPSSHMYEFPYMEDLNLIQVNPDLSAEEKEQVYKLLAEFHDVFL